MQVEGLGIASARRRHVEVPTDFVNAPRIASEARQSLTRVQRAQRPELLDRLVHMNSWFLSWLLLQDPRDGLVVL